MAVVAVRVMESMAQTGQTPSLDLSQQQAVAAVDHAPAVIQASQAPVEEVAVGAALLTLGRKDLEALTLRQTRGNPAAMGRFMAGVLAAAVAPDVRALMPLEIPPAKAGMAWLTPSQVPMCTIREVAAAVHGAEILRVQEV